MKNLITTLFLFLSVSAFADSSIASPIQACVIQSVNGNFESFEVRPDQYLLLDLSKMRIDKLNLQNSSNTDVEKIVLDGPFQLDSSNSTNSSYKYKGYHFTDRLGFEITMGNDGLFNFAKITESDWRPNSSVHASIRMACHSGAR